LIGRLGRSGQEAAAERGIGHESDPQLMRHREQDFHVALEQRVLGLQNGDGLDACARRIVCSPASPTEWLALLASWAAA
jgi:hypothetical protein